MRSPSIFSTVWNTSCAGQPPEISTLELGALGEHLVECGVLRSPAHTLIAGAETIQAVVADHVVTVSLLGTLLMGVVSLVW